MIECVGHKSGPCHFATVVTVAKQSHFGGPRHLVLDSLAEATALYDVGGRHRVERNRVEIYKVGSTSNCLSVRNLYPVSQSSARKLTTLKVKDRYKVSRGSAWI